MRILHACLLGAALAPASCAWADEAPVPPPGMKPVYVKPLFAEAGAGHNDSSPTWAYGGGLLAIERAEDAKREIVIARTDGSVVKTVYYQTETDDLGLGALLPGLGESVSYNAGMTWSGKGDRFVFMSNAGEGNYDLYLGQMDGKAMRRLTTDPEKDGQPNWSPTGGPVVFVSGRDGSANLYLLDPASARAVQITQGDTSCLYPRWSPDGKRIAATCGANANHDIIVFDALPDPAEPPPAGTPGNPSGAAGQQPAASGVSSAVLAAPAQPPVKPPVRHVLTTWRYDDLSPAWSPDGRRIAFYSNYNREGDPRIWSLVVIDADGTSPREGDALAARVVAYNVVPDISQGPAWLPDGKHIAYVRNDKQDYSPIYVVDVNTRQEARLETGTSINHDLAISSGGILAFRAQVNQWDQIFLVKLPEVDK